MFCRKLCELTLFENREKLGRTWKSCPNRRIKDWKKKVSSRACFIVCVDDRSEATLLKHILDWIEAGTIIVSDCWKTYMNLDKYGYTHKTVNHSVEFLASEGYDTNKQEGHWRQMKVNLPTHGRKNIICHIWPNLFGGMLSGSDLFKIFLKDVACVYKFE